MSASHGQFVWYDLVTTNKNAAIDFYKYVAGWDTQAYDKADYTMWTAGGAPIGGVVSTGAGVGDRPAWLPYVQVDDVSATAEKTRQLGGKLVSGPDEVPGAGRYAIIDDPQGARIGIYTSADPSNTPEFNPGPGNFSWHELTTTDYNKAFDFYTALFGWNRTGDFDMGPIGTYQMYGKSEVSYGGMFNKPADMPVPNNWLSYIMVDDVHAATERAKERGAHVIQEPMEVPGGDWISNLIDPQGAMFALHARSATQQ